jgi:hypothetical protein
VPQPRQRQTIAVHQMTAGGVGKRTEVGGRLNILCRLSNGRRRWWFGGLPWLWLGGAPLKSLSRE